MKTITVVAVMIMALLSLPAYSQSIGAGPSREPDKPVDEKKKTADDKAYNSAVTRIPEAKQEYDPWLGVREKPPAPPAKKK